MNVRYGIVTALTLDPQQMDYLLIEWPEDGTAGRMLGAFPHLEMALKAAHAKLTTQSRSLIEVN